MLTPNQEKYKSFKRAVVSDLNCIINSHGFTKNS